VRERGSSSHLDPTDLEAELEADEAEDDGDGLLEVDEV